MGFGPGYYTNLSSIYCLTKSLLPEKLQRHYVRSPTKISLRISRLHQRKSHLRKSTSCKSLIRTSWKEIKFRLDRNTLNSRMKWFLELHHYHPTIKITIISFSYDDSVCQVSTFELSYFSLFSLCSSLFATFCGTASPQLFAFISRTTIFCADGDFFHVGPPRLPGITAVWVGHFFSGHLLSFWWVFVFSYGVCW